MCSIHFKKEDFKENMAVRRLLKPTAVPSIFPGYPWYDASQNSTAAGAPTALQPFVKRQVGDSEDIPLLFHFRMWTNRDKPKQVSSLFLWRLSCTPHRLAVSECSRPFVCEGTVHRKPSAREVQMGQVLHFTCVCLFCCAMFCKQTNYN